MAKSAVIHESAKPIDPKAYGGAVQFGQPICRKASGRLTFRVTSDLARVTCEHCLAGNRESEEPMRRRWN